MIAIQHPRDYRILIADDDDRARESLREIVEPQGYDTVLASSGEEAVDIVRGIEVHLVLIDMHMPKLTGLETLQLARQFRAALPAILVTADASEAVIREAQQAQVYSVIPKPVNKNMMLYTLVRALARFYGDMRPREQD